MAKKATPIKEIYAVLNEAEELASWEDTLVEAKTYIAENELNNGKILKVTQIWEASYPEEPEIEFYETPLEDL